MSDELKLLVEWSDPWEEFRTAIRPALARSDAPLAGEARTGLWPFRGMAGAWVAEVVFLVLAMVLPAKYASLHPTQPSAPPKYDVLYYFAGDELPQTRDVGGARAGKSGRAGGKEAFHRSQTIRVARGESLVEKVVDAPDLKLPVSTEPVANLLALNRLPGPPPAEGLRASRTPVAFSKDAIVAPPPQVIRKLTRSTPTLPGSVIVPPPSNIASDRQHSLAGMTPNVIAPPPAEVAADRRTPMTGIAATIIAPAPTNLARQFPTAVVPMDTPITPPSPRDVRRDAPALTGPVAQRAIVVPPPVSAPERAGTQNPKLTLPAQAVIGPPPSQVVRDQRTVTGIALGDPNKVVPPPASAPNLMVEHRPGAVMGTAQIIPPPPSVGGGSSLSGSGGGHPNQHGVPGGTLGAANVIPPPPSLGGSQSGTGRTQGTGLASSLGGSPVPPPPNTSSAGSGSGSGSGRNLMASLGGGSVVPPPPNAAAGTLGGRGTGSKGSGLGGLMDAGSVEAPPTGGGSNGKGVVISASPGSAVGRPGSGGTGSLAMSPAGGDQPGLGGSGGGTGIGRGNGPGSGLNGEGSGAAKEGTGHGSDPNARNGTSLYPGPGGAGSGTTGQPAVPGVSVEGGHNIVNLPSFGSGGNDPSTPGRSGMGPGGKTALDVTVVATSRAGGAFNNYGQFKADKVYTKYLDTAAGRVSMQYFDATSAAHPYPETLTDPVPIRIELPTRLGRARLVIACILDRTGILRDLHVLEGGTPDMTAKVMAALPSWKFQPALHGSTPIDVTAILGFNIDTN